MGAAAESRIAEVGITARAALRHLHEICTDDPIGLELICTCEDCISSHNVHRLEALPASALTSDDLMAHFSACYASTGAAALDQQRSAWRLVPRWLDFFLEQETAGDGAPSYFLELDYPLFSRVADSRMADATTDAEDAAIGAVFIPLIEHRALRRTTGQMGLMLVLGMCTRQMPVLLDRVAAMPTAMRLAFWANALRDPISYSRASRRPFHDHWSYYWAWVSEDARQALERAICDPGLARLIERAFFMARDEAWRAYLSDLGAWLEMTWQDMHWRGLPETAR